MDSGNSGSMQSSSGGEEEYDSRAESVSEFLNHHSSTGGGGHHHPPPLSQPPQHHHYHSSIFDPLSNYFDPLSSSRSSPLPLTSSTNPNSLLNLDMVWSKGLRSGPNCTDLGGLFAASSSSSAASSSTQHLFTNHGALQSRTTAAAAATFPAAALHIPQGTAESAATRASVSGLNIDQTNIISGSNISNQNNNSGNSLKMMRNPKKRSRASRRAPTTVLTTDTTNFRAMVQEFTGIPAPPFTSSPFPRTRLDLFGTSGSSFRSTPTHLESSQPSYLLRPFAQKINPIPFVSPSSAAIASTTTTNITSGSATGASNNNHSNSNPTYINYQQPSDLGGLLKQQQPQNLLNINMQNPILNLQSLFQAPQKYSLNSPILETKQQGSFDIIPSNDSHLKIGVLDELGLSHSGGHHHLNTSLGGLQNIVSSEAATLPIRSDHQNNPTTWPSSSTNGTGSNEDDQVLLRSISSTGNYNSTQRVVNTNGKVLINNFMASPPSSDFHHHNHRDIKGQAPAENVTTRTEGMVESWICSSD